MTNYNGNSEKGKRWELPWDLIINFVIGEISVKRSISGKTEWPCEYTGTYYCGIDESLKHRFVKGEKFPPVRIPVSGTQFTQEMEVTWILVDEERPNKGWRDWLPVFFRIAILILTIFLIIQAIRTPVLFGS